MQVQNSVLNGMLKNVADPKLRETYGSIISGNFPYRVFCVDPQKLIDPTTGKPEKKNAHAKGILIGYIDGKGICIDEPVSRKDGQVVSGIETSRDRFDGRKGFKCYCGNWCIEAPEEEPIFEKNFRAAPPTKDMLSEIFAAITKSGKVQGYEFINGSMEYDGFKVEEIKI